MQKPSATLTFRDDIDATANVFLSDTLDSRTIKARDARSVARELRRDGYTVVLKSSRYTLRLGYAGREEFVTLSGGLLRLSLIAGFMALFAGMESALYYGDLETIRSDAFHYGPEGMEVDPDPRGTLIYRWDIA